MAETNEHTGEVDDSLSQECADSDSEAQALEQKLEEAENQKRDLIASGWKWHDHEGTRLLVHPDDPDVNVWFHPYTGEQLLSPKLVELLVESVRNSGT